MYVLRISCERMVATYILRRYKFRQTQNRTFDAVGLSSRLSPFRQAYLSLVPMIYVHRYFISRYDVYCTWYTLFS